MMVSARPSKNLGSVDVGSLVKRTRTLPVTSTPLKSSHLYSGAVMPWPTKMASPSKRVLGCCVWLTPTKSSSHLNSTSLPHTEALRVASGWVSMPTSGTFWKYVPSSPAGLAPARANWGAMYSVARSPPRAPTPRPSSKSSDRKRSCSRIRSAEIEPSWASRVEAAMTKIATGLSMIQRTLAGPAAANFRNFSGSPAITKDVGVKQTNMQKLRRIFLLLAVAIAAQAQTWDTSGNGMLSGTYYFRQVFYVIGDQYGDLGEAVTLYGNISFNGAGTYTLTSGQWLDFDSNNGQPETGT